MPDVAPGSAGSRSRRPRPAVPARSREHPGEQVRVGRLRALLPDAKARRSVPPAIHAVGMVARQVAETRSFTAHLRKSFRSLLYRDAANGEAGTGP